MLKYISENEKAIDESIQASTPSIQCCWSTRIKRHLSFVDYLTDVTQW